MSKHREIDLSKVKTTSIHDRKSKMDVEQLARPVDPGNRYSEFWESLPDVLASKDLHALVRKIVHAVRSKKPVLVMMGAHVIKVGLSPIIVDLLNKRVIHGIAVNGAGAIHDVELAHFGKTSEDVPELLKEGFFGMARETAEILNKSVQDGQKEKLGFGEILGKRIVEDEPEYSGLSILGQAYRLGIPVTVHAAIGTDIVHQHPSADGAAIGDTSLRDFRIWAELVSRIGNGGVVLLFGSSVILPEVFLKALTVARNVHGKVTDFTTANFDMIHHYRPQVNFIKRPTIDGGEGFNFIGHHEIMIPLLAAAIKEEFVEKRDCK
jgi:deoxyhypusine synthase